MTVHGLMSVPIVYRWTPRATYTAYLENTNNTIVYQQTVTVPTG